MKSGMRCYPIASRSGAPPRSFPMRGGDRDRLAGLEDDAGAELSVAQRAARGSGGPERDLGQTAAVPAQRDLQAATGFQAADRPVTPGGGQGGQEVDVFTLRLEEHFSDPRRAASIAVEGIDIVFGAGDTTARITEQGVVAILTDQAIEMDAGLFSVAQAGIEVDQIGSAPFGVFPVLLGETMFERDPGRGRQRRRLIGIDLRFGVERDEMGGVAMVRLCLFEILQPFLHLAMPANLERRQLRQGIAHALAQIGIGAENVAYRATGG